MPLLVSVYMYVYMYMHVCACMYLGAMTVHVAVTIVHVRVYSLVFACYGWKVQLNYHHVYVCSPI